MTSTTKEFIDTAIIVHSDVYDYSFVEYIRSKSKVKILCKIHGIFEQTPHNHLNGNGCRKCGRMKCRRIIGFNTDDFINAANKIHNVRYDYSIVKYINIRGKVDIICRQHGVFSQISNNHLRGTGCPKCTISKSTLATKWLESLNISDMIFEYRLPENLRKSVDGYSPSTNTVYQFHGDYWHGNPSRFNPLEINKHCKQSYGDLYKKTIESDKMILLSGYNLITIWESEYKL